MPDFSFLKIRLGRKRDKVLLNVPVELLDVASSITTATDLRDPLRVISAALAKLLDSAKGLSTSNKDRHKPFRRLLFHLDTIESQGRMLEEDFQIDKTIPFPNPAILSSLEIYASQLNGMHQLLHGPKSTLVKESSTDKVIMRMVRDMDSVFENYTDALHDYASQPFVPFKLGRPSPDPEPTSEARQKWPKVLNVYGAQHYSCIEGTREKTLKAIRKWAEDESRERPIFLLLDVAGSGKSTVAKHMANEWTRSKRLMARFFFSRDTAVTTSISSFCETIINAFCEYDPRLKASVKAFKKHPKFRLLSFGELFDGLIIKPLEELGLHALLIIDAVDECDNTDGGRDELLNALRTLRCSTPRLQVLVTIRHDLAIEQWAEDSGIEYTNFFQLEGDDRDMEVYIRRRLKNLPYIHDRLYHIIKKAGGVFIWARIACDLILDTVDVDGLLERLGNQISLDFLYEVALAQSIPNDEQCRQAFTMMLQMVLASREPLSIAELEIISPKRGIVEEIINRLETVLVYKDREGPVRLIHATFREFLTNQSKAGVYFIEPEYGHQILASGCFRTIGHHLGQDDATLGSLDEISERAYTYSSKSWGHHCTASYGKLALEKQIIRFARNELLTWADTADKWNELSTVSCLRDVLAFSRQKMSPRITETTTYYCLEAITRKLETSIYRPGARVREIARVVYGFGISEFLGVEYSKSDDEDLKRELEEFKATLPVYAFP